MPVAPPPAAPARLGEGGGLGMRGWLAAAGWLALGAREARGGRSKTRRGDAHPPPQVQQGVARVHLPLLGPLGTKEFADLSRSGGNLVFEQLLEVRSDKNMRTFLQNPMTK